ncbi:MAG: PQQ-binding-like beta-propeller repeat protein [Pirellulaceae bacterium]|nr:PQQ-binding-like beta-propeller repeat protein [Pirellulaceae bacterium]
MQCLPVFCSFVRPLSRFFTVSLIGLLLTSAVSADDGAAIIQQSGVQGGFVVHLGCGDGSLTASLRVGDQYIVHGLSTSETEVAAARKSLQAQGGYGPVSVDLWDGQALPYADNLVNLIVMQDAESGIRDEELMRVLAPGGVLLKISPETRNLKPETLRKPWPPEMDQWTHYFHNADGNPVSQDDMVGPPTQLRWIGSPRWSRHHDHMASMTSCVSAGGRLFYILDEGARASIQLPSAWRLIARDAFNGTILWKRDIDQWNTRQYPLKSGPAHLLRRLVAVDDRVFVTLGIDAPTVVLDGATGKTLMTFEGSEFTREIVADDGIVYAVADNTPSALPKWRRVSTYVWENTRTANPGWGWSGASRKIFAFQVDSGQRLWEAEAPVSPCSLAVAGSNVVFHDGEKLVCLDRQNGERLWESEPSPTAIPVQTNTGPRVLIYDDVVLLAANNGKVSGWSIQDGSKLWEQQQKPSGHLSLKDLLVADGLVWTGDIAGNAGSGVFTGYDPRTGEVKREFPPDVHVHWFHHRCYPAKATDKYLLTARNGTEFIDLKRETWQPNHWVRGGCIYGVMPSNGLTYASMDACGCQLEAKLSGFKALAAGPVPQPGKNGIAAGERLQKGPAFGQIGNRKSEIANPDDWPTYRHDSARSGASPVAVPADGIGQVWQAKIGGRLSAPTIAAGKVFVAAVDAHQVVALDAKTGEVAWSFTTGGRVDSPPTYYQGLVLFGSTDGYVYALDAKDGALAWRFRGAPVDRRMMAWEQLESAWPVHGSVLVHDDVLYCTAGRNMFLDGGIHFLRLDPRTGELLGEVVWDNMDPESGKEMHLAYLEKTRGNNMPVALSDILSCDGRHIWMRSQKIDFSGKRSEIGLEDLTKQPAQDCHLFCQIGFLDDDYFFRSYWTYGRRVSGGYGAWLKAGRLVPSGRILCFDDDNVYGFGRQPEYMVNASVLEYELFSVDKTVTEEAIARIGKAEAEINARSSLRNANSSDWLLRRFFPRDQLTATNANWLLQKPSVTARAMALCRDIVLVAGPPNIINERQIYRLPDAPATKDAIKRQAEALEGKHGGVLWALSKADGELLARYALDTIPVFDGLAAAGNALFLSTVDGRLLCLSGDAATPLPASDDLPVQIDWEQVEDPNYLLPLPVSKDEDFDRVTRCQVFEADLGYRLKPKGKGEVALALKKLENPVKGTATFKTRMVVPADARGTLRNGFLVFGDGGQDEQLIKCGMRLKMNRAVLVQGPLSGGQTTGAPVELSGNQPIDIVVIVDLDSQQVAYTANGVEVKAKLKRPLKSITHIGYAMDNAVVDFAPLDVQQD